MHQEMGTLNETGLCMINVVERGTPWTFVPSDLPTHVSLPLGMFLIHHSYYYILIM